MTRVWGFQFHRPISHGYNPTLGRHVRNAHDLSESLKVQSDIATARTGLVHDFQAVDPRDKEALGVTNEGLDSTYNQLRASGNTPAADNLLKMMGD